MTTELSEEHFEIFREVLGAYKFMAEVTESEYAHGRADGFETLLELIDVVVEEDEVEFGEHIEELGAASAGDELGEELSMSGE